MTEYLLSSSSITGPESNGINISSRANPELSGQFWTGFLSSFGIIFLSEIADKTFILIVFFSQKIPKLKLFLITSIGLVTMNIISVLIGYMIPVLLYKWLVDCLAIGSFLFMGIFLLYEARSMKLKTVEEKLIKYKKKHDKDLESKENQVTDTENGENKISDLEEPLVSKDRTKSSGVAWMLLTTIVLAEIGDRSQISTILISTTYNLWGVIVGSSLAHVICIIIAIYMGLWLGQYLNEKQMNYFGGVLFLLFAIQIMYEKYVYT